MGPRWPKIFSANSDAINHFIIALKQVYIKLIAYRQTLSQLKQTSLYKDFIDELGPLANNHNELIACHLLKVKEACLSHQLVDFNLEVIKEQIENFEQLLTKWREEERFSTYKLETVLSLFAFVDSMHAIQSNLQQLQDRFNHLVKGYPSKNVLYEKKEVEPIFPVNTASLKKAIKLSLAVFVLLLIHLFYGVESSLQSVITVAVILAQPNYGRAEHRGWLRFLGVIAGGLIGIVGLVILSYVSHFFVLLSYCFVCFFAFGYIALTGERWEYAGLQAAIMLPLILLVANGPVETLTLAGQRFVGVIIGVIIATVIAVLVWPEDPVKHLRQNISSILLDISRWFSRIMNLQRQNSVRVKHKIEAMLHGHEVLVYDTSQVVGETDKSESFFSLAALVNGVYVVINLLEKNLNDEKNNQLIKDSLPQFQPIVEQIEAHIFLSAEALLQPTMMKPAKLLIGKLLEVSESLRSQQREAGYATRATENYAMMIVSLQRLLQALDRIDKVINHLNSGDKVTSLPLLETRTNEAN